MFITKKKHDAIMREFGLRCVYLAEQRDAETKRANELAVAKDAILRDKLGESERAKLAESRVNSLLDEIEALKPDALKYRDREAAAAKRKAKGGEG